SSFLFVRRPPPRLPLFPYTTLFRSPLLPRAIQDVAGPRPLDGGEVLDDPADAQRARRRRQPRLVVGQPVPGVADPLTQMIDVRRSEEHTSELQSRGHLVCRLLLEKK